ncbi:ECF-type sigma factor [Pseudomarimonas salicorniae]|uniref:ECF-type sigma factor n=1 Tax=Pseudomarimonas salicorniae TaxID=2933270 RepID=A0ABT0GBZ0_9GAMM|nr:ECF-type sigma factor [Lysobacter sp. CAU 1642]MCK7592051.1 ECF-type sigma factor [Lysobacter sp. CAU 1642]
MTAEQAVEKQQLTQLLRAWSAGDGSAADAVLSMVYQRIRQLAAQRLRMDGRGALLQPTELANELIVNLLDARVGWQDRVHFFRSVAVALRNLLHDEGRRRASFKRGGDQLRVSLGAVEHLVPAEADDAGALHEALEALRAQDPRKADVVDLHCLVGLELTEVAGVLGISLATVNRDLRFARAWLRQRLDA